MVFGGWFYLVWVFCFVFAAVALWLLPNGLWFAYYLILVCWVIDVVADWDCILCVYLCLDLLLLFCWCILFCLPFKGACNVSVDLYLLSTL